MNSVFARMIYEVALDSFGLIGIEYRRIGQMNVYLSPEASYTYHRRCILDYLYCKLFFLYKYPDRLF